MAEVTPEGERQRSLALLRAEPRIRAAQPQVDHLLAALIEERYPHARGHLVALGYPVTVDGVSAALDAVDREVEGVAAAGGDLADLWDALDQAVERATGSGLIDRDG
jgi:hypothetical protein